MVFSSIIFVCMFLPAVYIINAVLPQRFSNVFLLLASLLLYAWGEPLYVLLLLGCVAVNYFMALLLGRVKRKKLLLAGSVIINIATLGIFKYADFATETLNSILGTTLRLPGIVMPIGISFFIFQALSYVIDVYRGECRPQRSFIKLALYITFFPQLIAGPIVKYHDIERFISKRALTLDSSVYGLKRFIAGLGKKVLIANVVSSMVDYIYALDGVQLNAPLGWIAAAGYALQIYFDFSGYSDMAIGMGAMFGFEIPENFNHPYAASSMREFWRRWHISLSSWFRDYLYIPLGGNRRGLLRANINRMIVFFLTGLWHGASWNFVIWGLGHGTLLLLESCGIIPVNKLKGRMRWLGTVYTVFCAVCLFVFFRADTLSGAFAMLGAMFGTEWVCSPVQLVYFADILTPHVIMAMLAGAIGCTAIPAGIMNRFVSRGNVQKCVQLFLTLALLAACVITLIAQTNNPFIYFRF